MNDRSVLNLPASLPADRRTRRLAITALTSRAIADEREREMRQLAGDRHGGIVEDWVGSTTSGVAAQLLLSEQLLGQGWAWSEILRSVWYRDEALREVALRA